MLRVRRSEGGGPVVFALSGRIEEHHVAELQGLLDAEPHGRGITFDLEEVRLVDRQVIRFLSACETHGVALKGCPSYIREWIDTGSSEP